VEQDSLAVSLLDEQADPGAAGDQAVKTVQLSVNGYIVHSCYLFTVDLGCGNKTGEAEGFFYQPAVCLHIFRLIPNTETEVKRGKGRAADAACSTEHAVGDLQ
jgi:hypothetical protein